MGYWWSLSSKEPYHFQEFLLCHLLQRLTRLWLASCLVCVSAQPLCFSFSSTSSLSDLDHLEIVCGKTVNIHWHHGFDDKSHCGIVFKEKKKHPPVSAKTNSAWHVNAFCVATDISLIQQMHFSTTKKCPSSIHGYRNEETFLLNLGTV